ncbi:hypothetical protein HHI36_020297 [Cryptolaemus montrouzieri]|uniref:RWD domain-containing protein n=1 Tax=Cryptolaemus montrouzieri TaxID=559131 RepID=A0ABD2NA16_9CUCU
MDNLSQQADEIEVLKSIYEDEWVEEDGNCSFSMQVTPDVKLFITLHPEYPSESPPKYELLAPELTKDQKTKIHRELKSIFEESMGSPILFQWIEKLKETAFSKPKKNKDSEVAKKVNVQYTPPTEQSKAHLEKFSKEVIHGPTIEDRKSVFQGHVCAVHSEAETRHFLEYLMENKKIAQATHNISAYRITKNSSLLQDCEDDGENHASKRLLHLLQILNLENVMIVVSRWYGGIQLGPDRFKHITNAARQALDNGGFIK